MILARVPLYLSFLCSVVWWLFSAQAPPDSKLRAAAEDDIRELVLKQQMMEWVTSVDKIEREAKAKTDKEIARHLNFRIFFVEVEKNDPSEAFLKRFADVPRMVKGVSGSTVSKRRMAVVDKRTGQPAIRFYVGKVEWKSGDSAEVEGGYHCDGLCAAGITFSVKLKEGKWTIASETTKWVS